MNLGDLNDKNFHPFGDCYCIQHCTQQVLINTKKSCQRDYYYSDIFVGSYYRILSLLFINTADNFSNFSLICICSFLFSFVFQAKKAQNTRVDRQVARPVNVNIYFFLCGIMYSGVDLKNRSVRPRFRKSFQVVITFDRNNYINYLYFFSN